MFCKKCGNQLNDGAVFCPKCGTPVTQNVETVNNTEEIQDTKSSDTLSQRVRSLVEIPKKKVNKKILIISVIAVVAVVIVICIVIGSDSSGSKYASYSVPAGASEVIEEDDTDAVIATLEYRLSVIQNNPTEDDIYRFRITTKDYLTRDLDAYSAYYSNNLVDTLFNADRESFMDVYSALSSSMEYYIDDVEKIADGNYEATVTFYYIRVVDIVDRIVKEDKLNTAIDAVTSTDTSQTLRGIILRQLNELRKDENNYTSETITIRMHKVDGDYEADTTDEDKIYPIAVGAGSHD